MTFFIVVAIVFLSLSTHAAEFRDLEVLRNNKVVAKFKVELARTNAERSRGLMFKKELPKDYGMFFIFKKDTVHPFWMKNTYVSLDILFIDKDKKIVSIERETKPLSEDFIYPNRPYRYTLEIPATYVDKFQIVVGDKIKLK